MENPASSVTPRTRLQRLWQRRHLAIRLLGALGFGVLAFGWLPALMLAKTYGFWAIWGWTLLFLAVMAFSLGLGAYTTWAHAWRHWRLLARHVGRFFKSPHRVAAVLLSAIIFIPYGFMGWTQKGILNSQRRYEERRRKILNALGFPA